MSKYVVTGGAGFIGANLARRLLERGDTLVLVDDLSRNGAEANLQWLEDRGKFDFLRLDLRDRAAVERLFMDHADVDVVVHLAGQTAVTTSVSDPRFDFEANALGSFNVLEGIRKAGVTPLAIYASTNKVYGDTPNSLPLIEEETRWEVDTSHAYAEHGIDETMSIDQSKHSVFGASKLAADVMVQEYGRYFGMKTVCFRGGCLTGPGHSGAELHGFLSYLMKCAITGTEYQIFGYKGKQVRDNIHSVDLVNCFHEFYKNPRCGEVYNIGGSRHGNCSMQEAIALCEEISGNKMNVRYVDENRSGDHIWYISDVRRFQAHFPAWNYTYDIPALMQEIHKGFEGRV